MPAKLIGHLGFRLIETSPEILGKPLSPGLARGLFFHLNPYVTADDGDIA